MSRLRSSFGCLLLLVAVASTAAAEAHPRLSCPAACDDDDDSSQPCGPDCGATCACCVVFHLVQPGASVGIVILPAPASRPYFAEPAPLISREGSDVFHIPKSPVA